MKTTKSVRDRSGVTLLELLLVVLIVGILAMIFLPVIGRAKARSLQIDCLSQLRQIGIAHHVFAHEHHSLFPFQVPIREGGTLEVVQNAAWLGADQWALPHFRALSNDLADPKILTCPSDKRSRALSFGTLRAENLSYAICVLADYNQSESPLCSDRNFRVDGVGSLPVVRFTSSSHIGWTGEIHEYEGNVLFAGGHVERRDSAGLQRAFAAPTNGVIAFVPVDPGSQPNNGSGSSSAGTTANANSGSAAAAFEGFFDSVSGAPRPNMSASSSRPPGPTPSPPSSPTSPSSRTDPMRMAGGKSTSVNPIALVSPRETNRVQAPGATVARLSPPSPPSAASGTSEEMRTAPSGVAERSVPMERNFWLFVLMGIVVATLVAILVYRHDRRKMIRSTRLRRMPSYGLMAERRRRGRW